VRAFTIGFADADYDEREYARRTAEACGVRGSELQVEAGDVEAVFRETVLWHYDEPFADYSYLPTYYVCREARRSITVALTGDGGDELFAGYGKYALLARRTGLERALTRPVTQLVAAGARAVAGGQGERLRRYQEAPESLLAGTLVTGTTPRDLRRFARGELAGALAGYDPLDVPREHMAKAPPAEIGLVNAMRYLDLKLTLGAGILTKVDRAAMAVSLETRPVLLHRGVMELAARIPPERLATAGEPKKLLRDALRPWLPSAVLDRPKMGFAMPLGRWLQGDLGHLAERAGERRAEELLDPAYAREVDSAHARGGVRTAELHNLIFLDHWLESWS
jgi:asparagine synthase (glutamine-hydrolysing)